MRSEVLNPGGEPSGLDPLTLSQRILAEARSLQPQESCARLDALAGGLQELEPAAIEGDAARTAFWINLYNALLLHRLCRRPLRGNLLRHLRLFDRVAYRVGDQLYTLNLIEHGILRGNRRPPLRMRRPLGEDDPRLRAAPARPDLRIHFALNCGARSCPPVRPYGAGELAAQLEAATLAYLRSETRIDPGRRRVTLPRLMRIYARDFGPRRGQLEFAAARLPELDDLLRGARRVRIAYGRFDWTVASSTPAGGALNRSEREGVSGA